ncbi:hypothetical protein [Streptomyces sp. CMSTAAHL-2]|uniref:hypothetical protein n=1 Tax=Streptomyces sp. CMSTAAHL-2 TaxID=2904522 RepID=UPI001E4124E4|nr:hypothetical protein [Streptomyces sp. CMSTAAHL-2]MCE3031680.1 hypothetical protein [Streptomyces sp. CMSTAAHL-2]
MADQPTTQRTHSFLRFAIALQTLTIFCQAVSAGLLLTVSYGQTLHGIGARVMYGAAMLYVLAAVLAWKPGGGSPRPIWHATGFLVLASVQVVLGIAHVPSVHVPLGVLMFALSVLALARQWGPARGLAPRGPGA